MSSSDDDDRSSEDDSPRSSKRGSQSQSQSQADISVDIEEPNDDTLRCLISTDNHLGYLESDPVRGLDTFAAFEEVLYLAKLHKVDMVLLGGDLFHHNKPSRKTLYKTMEILRKYTMGPDPVKIQILSDQAKDFRNFKGCVNYEDEAYSVDLPIFSIHGNHDDPSRDSGGAMLAALDLLSVSNFVNYFGRQEEVNKVEVSPVLIQKGKTKVALYGLGNMRDERLVRMWQAKKVKFLRVEGSSSNNNRNKDSDDEDDDDDNNDNTDSSDFFNIFILHQNRDNMGRGRNNSVHESMIPSWMDLAIFGHEHASEPVPTESLVGTFRITQPGSTVATSLTTGEAERKHAVVLNIRQNQFQMEPIPLTMVRSFVMKDVSLAEHDNLDPEDPKVDTKITKILEEELRMWIFNAREKDSKLLEDAAAAGNISAAEDSPLKYQLEKREQVLVRLRVEHTGFTTLNNQRFGARFVGDVANPTDILLFTRAKQKRAASGGGKKGRKSRAAAEALEDPIAPSDLQQTRVEDLVVLNLEEADAKMTILPQKALANALEEFVEKTEANAISDMAEKGLKKRQKALIKGTTGKNEKEGEGINSTQDVKKLLEKYSQQDEERSGSKRKPDDAYSSDEDSLDKENKATSSSSRTAAKKKPSKASKNESMDVGSSSDEDMVTTTQSKSKISKSRASSTSTSKGKSGGRKSGDIRDFTTKRSSTQSRKSAKRKVEVSSDSDDSEIEVVGVSQSAAKRNSPPRRRTARAKVNYSVDASSDEGGMSDDFDDEPAPKRSRGGRKAPSSQRSRRGGKSQDSSFGLDSNWGSASTRP